MIKKLIWAVTGLGILIAIVWFISGFNYLTWDFRNELWAPAYLLVHGESAYDITPLYSDGSYAVWFPQIIGFLFPLGYLSLNHASGLWMVLNILTILGLIIFLTRRATNGAASPFIYGSILLAVLLFPPTVTNLYLGQIDFILAALVLIGASKIEEHALLPVAFSFVIAISKPQTGFVVLPSLVLFLLLKQNLNYGLRLLLCVTVLFAGLTIPLWIADASWVQDFMHNLRINHGWLQPSQLWLLQYLLGKAGLFVWFAVVVACIAISTFLWIKVSPVQAALWSLALTTIAAPYIWSWDFTLLLPLFIDTAARLRKIQARLTLALTWIVCFYFFIWSRQFTQSDHRLWWMPLGMLAGITTSLWMEYSSNKESVLLNAYTQPVP